MKGFLEEYGSFAVEALCGLAFLISLISVVFPMFEAVVRNSIGVFA